MKNNNETKHTLKVEISNLTDKQRNAFIRLFEFMQKLGKLGHTRQIVLDCDGDGDFRPNFNYDFATRYVYPEETNLKMYDHAALDMSTNILHNIKNIMYNVKDKMSLDDCGESLDVDEEIAEKNHKDVTEKLKEESDKLIEKANEYAIKKSKVRFDNAINKLTDKQKEIFKRNEEIIKKASKWTNHEQHVYPDTNPGLHEHKTLPQQGWVCPKCGRVNSPNTTTCPCYYEQNRLGQWPTPAPFNTPSTPLQQPGTNPHPTVIGPFIGDPANPNMQWTCDVSK